MTSPQKIYEGDIIGIAIYSYGKSIINNEIKK